MSGRRRILWETRMGATHGECEIFPHERNTFPRGRLPNFLGAFVLIPLGPGPFCDQLPKRSNINLP